VEKFDTPLLCWVAMQPVTGRQLGKYTFNQLRGYGTKPRVGSTKLSVVASFLMKVKRKIKT
jgi:hypothetical protein